MKRAVLLVLDSFGVGAADDAERFGDQGSDTLGHIAEQCFKNLAEENRHGPLEVPHLNQLGLGRLAQNSRAKAVDGLAEIAKPSGAYGYAKEISSGKDTPSGHWEIAGVPVLFDWGYFPDKENSFPKELLDEIVARAELPGFLGNCHASGTTIIEQLGLEHMQTGKPIFYTSADSVFQIACHEQTFGLERLYDLCHIVRELLDDYNIGRVIARPFVGDQPENFSRTGNRHDYSVTPPSATVLDKLVKAGGSVISIGKIADIYAHQGITRAVKATGLEQLFDTTLQELAVAGEDSLVFTNFVDFDSSYGHRRDVSGYARALEYFDRRLPELLSALNDDDLLIMTADHGCDPTWQGTEHTREHIPVLVYGKKIQCVDLGKRETFADIGQTLADYFSLTAMEYGSSFWPDIKPE
ncbi:phosphopentomutase [Celerinatantimonas diazotrophica]|uniref:Phosphopentomutase n=1 Tax=Celerinatantimonas diazotrophica TaxID=412034 RepID=A0A4R1J973_9GAMM|nr:phosphopentomutase [Celerinatantimonas diazotrophica]TCK47128.1 phosphopentomutase [Celerinatantimonas diazotrophica]CAG9295900.1 Phosphopentomutase [Celerinatantimonas diazotrophica]